MKISRDKNFVGFIVVALMMGGLLWFSIAAWNQDELNYALTEAVGRRDIPRVRQLLEAGANPNAQWSGYSWRDRVDCLIRRTDICEKYTVLDYVKGDAEMTSLLLKYRAKTVFLPTATRERANRRKHLLSMSSKRRD